MIEKIDILSFCKVLTDLTNKDKCQWRPTPHMSRDRLDFITGYIEITLYPETKDRKKCYCIDLFSNDDIQYMPFEVNKEDEEEAYKVFGDLYKAIWFYYDRIRNNKIISFYKEIMDLTSKQ